MKKAFTVLLLLLPLAALSFVTDTQVRLKCPNCGSHNTWAKYEHSCSCGAEWTAQAIGPSEDGRPYPMPCPAPGCQASVPAGHVVCHSCGHTW